MKAEHGVRVDREQHGPCERVVLLPLGPPNGASLSVYRVGDTLFDTGGSRVRDALLRLLDESPPRRIVLTHQHEDHSGNVAAIVERFGDIPVHAPRDLIAMLTTFDAVPDYRKHYWGTATPIRADLLVPYDAGDAFEVAGLEFVALHTPGHTPPHHAFVCESEGRAFVLSGDLYSSRPLEAFLESSTPDTIRTYRGLARYGSALRMLPTHGRVREDAARVLADAAAWLEAESIAIESAAAELSTRDPILVATHRYGPDTHRAATSGEMGASIFVRSVLDPVTALPAHPLL